MVLYIRKKKGPLKEVHLEKVQLKEVHRVHHIGVLRVGPFLYDILETSIVYPLDGASDDVIHIK